MNVRQLTLPILVLVFALLFPLASQAAEIIPAGNDYLITAPGTSFMLGTTTVNLLGNPGACGAPCLYGSDTVVTRAAEVLSPSPDVPGQIEGTISASIT